MVTIKHDHLVTVALSEVAHIIQLRRIHAEITLLRHFRQTVEPDSIGNGA